MPEAQQVDLTLHVSLYARDLDDGPVFPGPEMMFIEEETGEGMARVLYSLSAEQSLQDGTLYVDARTVVGLLRVLYNSSFLSRQHSEFALELLTPSYFPDGLRCHPPTDVVVASKFGFHGSEVSGQLHHELHECGIIYRPRSLYVICVMTRTDRSSPESLDQLVGEISRIIWAQQTD